MYEWSHNYDWSNMTNIHTYKNDKNTNIQIWKIYNIHTIITNMNMYKYDKYTYVHTNMTNIHMFIYDKHTYVQIWQIYNCTNMTNLQCTNMTNIHMFKYEKKYICTNMTNIHT